MNRFRFARLVVGAFCGLVSYDLVSRTRGFGCIHNRVARLCVARGPVEPQMEELVCRAVGVAGCFYWKRVLCLQRSVVTTLSLKKRGVHAKLVIGYRRAPFFSHAWVEVDSRVVNDSAAYKERLQILCRV
jgi:hypothetical protein